MGLTLEQFAAECHRILQSVILPIRWPLVAVCVRSR
jgi:hypothetical protein